jgi:lactoylglutathione lyase
VSALCGAGSAALWIHHTQLAIERSASGSRTHSGIYWTRSRRRTGSDFPDFTLIYLSNPETEFELELTVNKGQTDPMTWATATAIWRCRSSDLDERMSTRGSKPKASAPRKLVEFAPAGELVARFFFVADPDGYQIEVLERGGRFK